MIGWRSSIPLAIFVAGSAIPPDVPIQVSLGLIQVYLFEPFLAVAIIYAATRLKPCATPARFIPLLLVVAAGGSYGMLRGHDYHDVIYDIRGLSIMLGVTFVATRVAADGTLIPSCLRALRWSLWWSAALHLLATTRGLELAGRQELVAGTEATRVLSPATHVGLAVLCGCVMLMLAGTVPLTKLAVYLVPALWLVFIGFSRNAVLALAVAVLFALLFSQRGNRALAAVKLGYVAALLVTLTLSADAFLGIEPPEQLTTQATAFQQRVVDGLSSSARARDSSANYRTEENDYMLEAIAKSPAVGNGFGYHYKPAYGTADSFTAIRGPIYGHNFYLWIVAKAGVVGLLAFLILALPLVFAAALRSRSPAHVVSGGVLAAFLSISIVVPIAMSASDSAFLMGCLLGLAAGFRGPVAPEEESPVPTPLPRVHGSHWA